MFVAAAVVSGVTAYLSGASLLWTVAIGAVTPLLMAAVPRFLLATAVGAFTPSPQETNDAMSGTEFEDHVARIARSCGVPVIMTAVTGDWGVDLIVGRRPESPCDAMQDGSHGRSARAPFRRWSRARRCTECTKTMVVTNHEFTPAARKLAELHGCELVGGAELPRLRSTIRG